MISLILLVYLLSWCVPPSLVCSLNKPWVFVYILLRSINLVEVTSGALSSENKCYTARIWFVSVEDDISTLLCVCLTICLFPAVHVVMMCHQYPGVYSETNIHPRLNTTTTYGTYLYCTALVTLYPLSIYKYFYRKEIN